MTTAMTPRNGNRLWLRMDRSVSIESLLRRHPEQAAGIRIFEHPERAVRPHLHVADFVADAPAFGRCGAALAIERDAVQCLGAQAADECRSVPLRKEGPVVEG